MPSLAIPMNPLADLTFPTQTKKLSVDWSQPQGEAGQQYTQAFEQHELTTVPEPMCYFWPQSLNKYHTDAAKEIGKNFKDFTHEALDKTKMAVDMWRLQAQFKDLKVMSVSAIGTPGCLDAPDLKDCYVGWMGSGNKQKYIDAVKEGVSKCWGEWSSKVMIPGLPWYPAFAAYPGPMAPPMPNVPIPLIALPSTGIAKMLPMTLRDAMCDALDQGMKDEDTSKQHEALFFSIGVGVSAAFLGWLPMQQVMMVMGKGPVPSFAPPYVPVGPVVAGDNVPMPNLMT